MVDMMHLLIAGKHTSHVYLIIYQGTCSFRRETSRRQPAPCSGKLHVHDKAAPARGIPAQISWAPPAMFRYTHLEDKQDSYRLFCLSLHIRWPSPLRRAASTSTVQCETVSGTGAVIQRVQRCGLACRTGGFAPWREQ